jgi:hypothetical protein
MVPLLMENCAECTYPVSEEVSMGFIFVGSNVLVINQIRILVNMCIYVRIFKMHVYLKISFFVSVSTRPDCFTFPHFLITHHTCAIIVGTWIYICPAVSPGGA